MDIDLFLSGCVLSLDTFSDDIPIDFFVAGSERILVAGADWWTINGWGRGAGLLFLGGTVVQKGNVWMYTGSPEFGGEFGAPEDGRLVEQLANAHLRCDVSRADYLTNLQSLADDVGNDFDLTPWIAAWLNRPEIDAVEYALDQQTRRRTIATLKMFDRDGQTIGGLAVDEDGRAAASGTSPWLESMAVDYRSGTFAPDLETYINWLSDRMPQGAYTLGGAQVLEQAGAVEDVAQALLTHSDIV